MPVSAMAKFAPLIPMSAARYFWRITPRAIIVSASGSLVAAAPSFFWNSSLIWSRVRCIAGKTK